MASPQQPLLSFVERWLASLECESIINTLTHATNHPPASPPLSEGDRSATHVAKKRRIDDARASASTPDCHDVPRWCLDMPTTPPPTARFATPSRTSGPLAKRRRVEPDTGDALAAQHDIPLVSRTDDPEKTPTASRADSVRLLSESERLLLNAQLLKHPLPRPTTPGRRLSPGKRGASPVKGMSDLQRLRKPVQFTPLPIGRRRKEVLPKDVHKLAADISNRTIGGFVPGLIRDEFAHAVDCDLDDLPAVWVREEDEGDDKETLLRELRGLRSIHRVAIESAEFRRSEPAWNAKVHQPVLDLALDDGLWHRDDNREETDGDTACHRVGAEYISTATLTGDCIPRLRAQYHRPVPNDETGSTAGSVLACSATSSDSATSGPWEEDVGEADHTRLVHDATIHSRAGSKKVDFALIVTPGRGTRLAHAVDNMIDKLDAKGLANLDAGLPLPSLSINPTQYEPLQRRPIACLIETKIVPDAHDPQVLLQLGFMVAALHQRMDGFLTHAHPPTYITTPVISVVCHDWTLHFACDRRTHIELMGPLYLGSTKSMEDIYKLVACLRAIQTWIQEEYCPWLMHWLAEP